MNSRQSKKTRDATIGTTSSSLEFFEFLLVRAARLILAGRASTPNAALSGRANLHRRYRWQTISEGNGVLRQLELADLGTFGQIRLFALLDYEKLLL